MGRLLHSLARRPSYALGWRVGPDQARIAPLKPLQLAHQPVKGGVADLGAVLYVVEPLVPGQFGTQSLCPFPRLVERALRNGVGRHRHYYRARMQFRSAVCVFNPVSGGGTGRDMIGAVRRRLLRFVGEVDIAPTQSPNHAAELARAAASEGRDLIVVQGGDGTVNEVAQGLAGQGSPAVLVLPGGTANVLVNELGLPSDPIAATDALPTLAVRKVSLGLVEFESGDSRFFVVMCGAGLDAEIAARTPTQLKNRLGLGAFWLRGSGQIMRPFPCLRIASIDAESDVSRTASLVVVSKSRVYGGGLVLTPSANLLAGRLEIAVFEGTGRLRFCGYLLAGVVAATGWWPGVRHRAGTDVRIEPASTESVRVQVDGEVAGILPARVSLSPKTISLLMPPGYGREHMEPEV